jgi:hypothetical protein
MTPVISFYFRISLRIFVVYSGPGGNWFLKKPLKSKISCQAPFNLHNSPVENNHAQVYVSIKLCDRHLTRIFICVVAICKILTLYHGHVGFPLCIMVTYYTVLFSPCIRFSQTILTLCVSSWSHIGSLLCILVIYMYEYDQHAVSYSHVRSSRCIIVMYAHHAVS